MFSHLLLLTLTVTATYGADSCFNADLGISRQFCQPCGTPGLDDFCVKRYGACGNYVVGGSNLYGLLGGGAGLPPHGYLSTGSATAPPATCQGLIDLVSKLPNRNLGTNTIPIYNQIGSFPTYGATKIPRVAFNNFLLTWLRIDRTNVHQCLENNVPKHPYGPNGRWNTIWTNPRYLRLDSFDFEYNGNNTWSYQCYCDFCNACQSCADLYQGK
ncbi:hypothetical protein BgiMline_029229 [Biomphalaria glabrata]|nr:hypothetical protein BgiMline_025854 [Biomphalaria glabrata]